jgi:hypothetical protein
MHAVHGRIPVTIKNGTLYLNVYNYVQIGTVFASLQVEPLHLPRRGDIHATTGKAYENDTSRQGDLRCSLIWCILGRDAGRNSRGGLFSGTADPIDLAV